MPPTEHRIDGTFTLQNQMLGAGLWRKLAGAIGLGTPRVGDPLFDDIVKVHAPPRGPMMQTLQERPGLQDAVLDILGHVPKLRMTPEFMQARLPAEAYPPEGMEMLRGMLAIAAHLRA